MCGNNNGFGNCWWIIILILLICCCGCGGSIGCGGNNGCGCGCDNNCGCGWTEYTNEIWIIKRDALCGMDSASLFLRFQMAFFLTFPLCRVK